MPERIAVRRRGHRRPSPPPAAATPIRALPFRLTRFIGRQREIAELRQLLGEQRLITIVGPGGAGKTRLALALAASVPELHFADLAAVTAPELCTRALADALGVRQEAGLPLVQTIGAHLRRQRAVVVLDNCEHVTEAASELAAGLLQLCPELSILATSRAPLDLPGELLWTVPRLALPRPEAASVMQSDAGRLFLDRARLVNRELEVDRETAPEIAAICAELDGLPLAIELAAGQAGVLSLEAIHSGLKDHLGLLKIEARVEGRHATLRAAVEWSYKRLGPADQALFDSLAVFAGAFSYEAASTVAGATDPALRRLVKSSLLTTAPGSHTQYRLLETLRAFGRARLDETGRLSEVSARFLRYYADLAARAELGLRAREQRSWLDRLELELPNLREAIRVGTRDDPSLAQQIFAGTTNFWNIRGYIEEGCELAEAVLRAGGQRAEPRALVGLAEILYEIDSTRGRAAVEAAAARSRAGGLEVEARLDLVRAALAHDAKEPGRGRDAAARALKSAVKLGRQDLEVLAHGWLCKAEMEEGRLSESRAEGELATALARSSGDDYLLGFALDQLGHLALKEADLESATAHHQASLKAWQAVDTPLGVQHALMNLGLLALEAGDSRAAGRTFEHSYALAQGSGDRLALVAALHGLGQAAAVAGDVGETEARFGAALKLSNELASTHSMGTSLRGLARAAFMRGQMARGLRLAAAAAAIYPGHAGPLDRYPRQQLDAQIASAKAALGSRAADAAWRSGSAMDSAAAVAYAVEVEQLVRGPVLSPREKQIVSLLTRGLSNKQIASALAISERTAEGHVERTRNKLGLANRAQVAAWGVEHRLS